MDKKDVEDCFYEPELQKVKYTNVYLVEKILRRKGSKLFVKRLGLDKSHKSQAKSILHTMKNKRKYTH